MSTHLDSVHAGGGGLVWIECQRGTSEERYGMCRPQAAESPHVIPRSRIVSFSGYKAAVPML